MKCRCTTSEKWAAFSGVPPFPFSAIDHDGTLLPPAPECGPFDDDPTGLVPQNEETAINNAYQQDAEDGLDTVALAQAEFDGLVDALRKRNVAVCVQEDDPERDTPDALFPNNWVSFHQDGRVGLYPMFAVNRRRERREELLMRLASDHARSLEEIVDFTEFESHDVFLEGTGSVILDRLNQVAYASLGPAQMSKPPTISAKLRI